MTDELKRLNKTLGPADQGKINQYVEAVRDVERRIQQAEAAAGENPLPDLDRPVGVPASYAEHARLMFDLQVLAMQADITRVITFQLAAKRATAAIPKSAFPKPITR